MEKAAHRGAEEAHHDVPGLELGEGGCCWLLPHLRDLGMGRVTEPWWKAALGKGLESKDQAVGSSDGHCHGQNSCCGSGGGGETHVKEETRCSALEQKRAWVPSL